MADDFAMQYAGGAEDMCWLVWYLAGGYRDVKENHNRQGKQNEQRKIEPSRSRKRLGF
jgi:hypothetical protein